MSKIEGMLESDKTRLIGMLRADIGYGSILKEFQKYNLNKVNLSNYRNKMLGEQQERKVIDIKLKPEITSNYLIDSLTSNILICDAEIEDLRKMKHQTSSTKLAISSLLGRKTESLKNLESFIKQMQSDLEMEDVREFIDFMVYKKQKKQEAGKI
ncbi:MAG: hypothetical protein ABIH76_06245 [Candidatus Bathyarchaeota archaeon]